MAVQRLNRLTDLLGQTLGGLVISLACVLFIDGIFALLGLGEFGDLSGWSALIFPIIIFVGQFSAARGERGRVLVAAIGVLLGFGLGSLAAGAFSELPPIGSGAIGALVAAVVYAGTWHIGLAVAAKST